MIELDFLQFHEERYRKKRYELYVLKNGLGDILYIGISTGSIWERWFGWGGHMLWDGKVIYGESPIGVKIENHLPDSLNWKIQLWTLKDCIRFCGKELPNDFSEVTIHDIEPIMIRKLSPTLNLTYNFAPGKDTTPKSQKEKELEQRADTAYDEIFNKKNN
jgi:hypothetical protein